MTKIDPSEITPEHIYLSRKEFLKGMGILSAGSLALAACGGALPSPTATQQPQASATPTGAPQAGTDELGDPLTTYEAVTNFNNYYEFTTDKERVAELAADFPTHPWTLSVGGLVKNPKTYDIDELLQRFTQQERIYRLRCVEGWSMVIPWMGFPIAEAAERSRTVSECKICPL